MTLPKFSHRVTDKRRGLSSWFVYDDGKGNLRVTPEGPKAGDTDETLREGDPTKKTFRGGDVEGAR